MSETQQNSIGVISVPTHSAAPCVAVFGVGIDGLTCAHDLSRRGCGPVVLEAVDGLGGRCSPRPTRVGWFDDDVQSIVEARRLASCAVQRPGELAIVYSWTVSATPGEDEPKGRDRDKDEDEADATRILKLRDALGVSSMSALANAVARRLDAWLHTPIQQAPRRGADRVLRDAAGGIDEDFQVLVPAIPAPRAVPLAQQSPGLAAALRVVRYQSRWLLRGSERSVGLPGYREFQDSPIERAGAGHDKPGRPSNTPQRWFVEADEQWSPRHAHDDAETVADFLLDNFRAQAGRSVTPNFLCAHQWRHAFVDKPAAVAQHLECLWDDAVQFGVSGGSVAVSQIDRADRSRVALRSQNPRSASGSRLKSVPRRFAPTDQCQATMTSRTLQIYRHDADTCTRPGGSAE